MTAISPISKDFLFSAFQFLDEETLTKVSLVSKEWRQVSQDNRLWAGSLIKRRLEPVTDAKKALVAFLRIGFDYLSFKGFYFDSTSKNVFEREHFVLKKVEENALSFKLDSFLSDELDKTPADLSCIQALLYFGAVPERPYSLDCLRKCVVHDHSIEIIKALIQAGAKSTVDIFNDAIMGLYGKKEDAIIDLLIPEQGTLSTRVIENLMFWPHRVEIIVKVAKKTEKPEEVIETALIFPHGFPALKSLVAAGLKISENAFIKSLDYADSVFYILWDSGIEPPSTVLEAAIDKRKSNALIERILNRGVQPLKATLSKAIRAGYPVEILRKFIAKAELTGELISDAFCIYKENFKEVVELLLKAGAPVTDQALKIAIEVSDVAVEMLLDKTKEVDASVLEHALKWQLSPNLLEKIKSKIKIKENKEGI